MNGFKLAVKEINADGGIFGKQIKLESMDDKGDVIEHPTPLTVWPATRT